MLKWVNPTAVKLQNVLNTEGVYSLKAAGFITQQLFLCN